MALSKVIVRYICTIFFCFIIFNSCSYHGIIYDRRPAAKLRKLSCQSLFRWIAFDSSKDIAQKSGKEVVGFVSVEEKSSLLVKGEFYRLFHNHNQLLDGAMFLREITRENKQLLVFSSLVYKKKIKSDNLVSYGKYFVDEQSLIIIEKQKVHDYKKIRYKNPNEMDDMSLKDLLLSGHSFLHQVLSFLVYPEKKIMQKGTVSASLNIANLHLQSLAKKSVESLSEFYGYYEQFGFLTPKDVKIIFRENTLWGSEPYAIAEGKIFNIFSLNSKMIINMSPVKKQTKFMNDISVLTHEATHVLLFQLYNKEAFINDNSAFAEAFADFLTANFRNDPYILPRFSKEGKPLRDIKNRVGKIFSSEYERLKISDINGMDFHDDGMIVSNTLWLLREKVGKQMMSKNLRNIIDNLNAYYPSYKVYLKSLVDVDINKIKKSQAFLYDYLYLLAVLKKMSAGNPMEKEILEVVNELSLEYTLSGKKIRDIQNKITFSNEDIGRNLIPKSHGEGTVIVVKAIIGVGIEALLLNIVYSNLRGRDSLAEKIDDYFNITNLLPSFKK